MRDWYKAGDKKLEALNRENARIFRKSRLTLDFDNINQPVKEIRSEAKRVYRKLKKKSDKAYLDIGLLVYMEAFKEADPKADDSIVSQKAKKAINGKWLEEFHREYNPVTKYVYENELERKQARFFESIVADVEAKDRHEMEADYKAAENAWKRQTRQAMIDTEDRAAVTAYRDAGVEKVMWISVCDNRTCEECSALNGLIFPVDSVPDKPHYNCRCHLEPVRRLPKQPEDDIINTKVTDDGKVTNPMDRKRYAKIQVSAKKNGVTIMEALGDDLRYLRYGLGAEATYSNGYIMHIGTIPSASALFEELIHAAQARKYGELSSSSAIELTAREVAANRKLLAHGKAYGFDATDFDDIKNNLAYWEKRYRKESGYEYDDGKHNREV